MDCRQTILDLVNNKPKHYSVIIKKSPMLTAWVATNTLFPTGSWVEQIYSAVYQDTGICPEGNQKRISRWSLGFNGCGPANICKCTKEKISAGVSATKMATPAEEVDRSNKKRQATMLEKYGSEFNMLRPDLASSYSKPKIPMDVYEKLSDFEYLNQEYNVKKRTSVDIADELSVNYSTVIEYCKMHGFKIRKRSQCSLEETQISRFIESLGLEVDMGNWDILQGKELDIVIPDRKIGIEINGLYWHSYHPNKFRKGNTPPRIENQRRHLEKTLEAESVGYRLIHIIDRDWREKRPIVESMLRSKLGLSTVIPVDSCVFNSVSQTTAQNFFTQNYIHGYLEAKFNHALILNDEPVMMISVGHNRDPSSNKSKYEIYQIATKLNHTVNGGLSILIKNFQKSIPGSLLVTCPRDWSTGSGFTKIGGKLVETTEPDYFWTDGTSIIQQHQTNHSHLVEIFGIDNVDFSRPPTDIMLENNLARYWDCGTFKFLFESTS